VDEHPAVHIERDARAIGGQVAGQEDAGAGHIVGAAQAGQRNRGGDLALALGVSLPLMMSVPIRPGVMQLMRMPWAPNSRAMARARPSTPALAAE
jgi:hypothetical protein